MNRQLMLFWESVRLAAGSLLGNKLRSSLTILGIVIGVASIISMVSIISGLGRSIRSQIDSLGTGVLYVSKYEAGLSSDREEQEKRPDMRREDAATILANCPSVRGVSPEIKQPGFAEYGGKRTSILAVFGATETHVDVHGWNLEEGRALTEYDVRHRADVCVLGSKPSAVLFPEGRPLGRWIEVEGHPCRVIGVLEEKGNFLGQSMDDIVVVPLTVASGIFGMRHEVDQIVAVPHSAEYADEAIDEITGLMRRIRGLAPADENNFSVLSQDDLLELYNQITGAFFLITIIVSSIGLLVGGIGVMNMMLVTVKERTREIGTRIAIGARKKDVLFQFLLESIALALIGGVTGMVLGFLIAGIVSVAGGIPMAVTQGGILGAVVLSMGIGVTFGLLPAYRASRLDPIEALRHE